VRSLSRGRLSLAIAAGGVAAILALAPGASAQNAACDNAPNIVNAEGASFQRSAQLAWGVRILAPNPADPLTQGFGYDVSGCEEFQVGGGKEVQYAPTGSGAGRTAFGANGDGTTRESDKDYGGTDEPPSDSQLAAANAGIPADPTDDGVLHTIPVAQSSIVVAVRLPDGCSVDSSEVWGVQLTRAQIEGAFASDDNFDTWGQVLPNIQGEGCSSKEFARVVRLDSSGTTFQFKKYLQAAADVEQTPRQNGGWSSLANQTWPENTTVVRGAANGNGPLLQALDQQGTNGGVGYSDLATARAEEFGDDASGSDTSLWGYAQRIVDDNIIGPAREFDGDQQSGAPGSACDLVRYDDESVAGIQLPDTTESWFDVDAVDTPLQYPICTLTYALTWQNACENDSTQARADVTEAYLGYNVDNANSNPSGGDGQRLLLANDYAPLTETAPSVQNEAEEGVNELAWSSPC
jgi:ABC-type phosphate transport system substrate-binding protein